ncbi:MAG: hypothetical protein LBH96_01970 [Candidatus Peribacteria bacterium]|jgi:hypothetical protein|nr:hypothetical protein [Candidatus Peribacteria bacterium]
MSYTISACNVGTNIAGTGEESYGSYFQWGNNYPFSDTILFTSDVLVDVSTYGP